MFREDDTSDRGTGFVLAAKAETIDGTRFRVQRLLVLVVDLCSLAGASYACWGKALEFNVEPLDGIDHGHSWNEGALNSLCLKVEVFESSYPSCEPRFV